MKKLLLILVIGLSVMEITAQFSPQKIITDKAMGARAVFAADIDNDGFMDVVSASSFDNTVACYKNLNGTGNFGKKNIISSKVNSARDIFIADINGDDSADVLTTMPFDDNVVWFANQNGLGDFSDINFIATNIAGPLSIIAADLDNDNDNDVIVATFDVDKLVWYKNIDGLGLFSVENVISLEGVNGRSLVASDIDSDGDIDIVATATGNSILVWFENLDGLGNFSSLRAIGDSGAPKIGLFAADIDDDGDIDLITASVADDRVSWYENLDGLGNYGPEQIISTEADFALEVFAVDLDNDGDVDVLSSSGIDNKIAWYENLDGQGTFGTQNIITTDAMGTNFVHAADLDNDGDIDVLSASQTDHKVAWYENFTILGSQEHCTIEVSLYPNPVKGQLFIGSSDHQFTSAVIHSALGKNMGDFPMIDNAIFLRQLSSGVYFITLETEEGESVTKKFVKE